MKTPIKLLLTWDIMPGQEEACFSFITQDLPPAMQNAGLELTDAWFTAHGDWPQIRIGFVGTDLQALEAYLVSDAWRRMRQQLAIYTQNYRERVVVARGGFQI